MQVGLLNHIRVRLSRHDDLFAVGLGADLVGSLALGGAQIGLIGDWHRGHHVESWGVFQVPIDVALHVDPESAFVRELRRPLVLGLLV